MTAIVDFKGKPEEMKNDCDGHNKETWSIFCIRSSSDCESQYFHQTLRWDTHF